MRSLQKALGDMPPERVATAQHPTFTERIAEMNRGTTSIHDTLALFDAGVTWFAAGRADRAAAAF